MKCIYSYYADCSACVVYVFEVVLYGIHQMDSIVSNSYILVYIHTLVGAESDMAEFCLKQLFTVTDNRYSISTYCRRKTST